MGRAPYTSAKEGGWTLFRVVPHLTTKERPCYICLQRLDALEANNWTNNTIERNHQWFRSQVLTAHNL